MSTLQVSDEFGLVDEKFDCVRLLLSRAMHCMDCRVCIEEYDHHCPWTGKCIGKRNVRYFYAWLFFLVLAFVYEMIEFTTYFLPPDDRNVLDSLEIGSSVVIPSPLA